METEPIMPKNPDIEDILDEIGSYYIDDDFNFICPSFRSYSTRVSWDGRVTSPSVSALASFPNKICISTPPPTPPVSDSDLNESRQDEHHTIVIHQAGLNTLENLVSALQSENEQGTENVEDSPRRRRRERKLRLIRSYGKSNYDRMKIDPEFKLQFIKCWKEQQQRQNKETMIDHDQHGNDNEAPAANNNGNDTDDTLALSFEVQNSDSDKDKASADGFHSCNSDADQPERSAVTVDFNVDWIFSSNY